MTIKIREEIYYMLIIAILIGLLMTALGNMHYKDLYIQEKANQTNYEKGYNLGYQEALNDFADCVPFRITIGNSTGKSIGIHC